MRTIRSIIRTVAEINDAAFSAIAAFAVLFAVGYVVARVRVVAVFGVTIPAIWTLFIVSAVMEVIYRVAHFPFHRIGRHTGEFLERIHRSRHPSRSIISLSRDGALSAIVRSHAFAHLLVSGVQWVRRSRHPLRSVLSLSRDGFLRAIVESRAFVHALLLHVVGTAHALGRYLFVCLRVSAAGTWRVLWILSRWMPWVLRWSLPLLLLLALLSISSIVPADARFLHEARRAIHAITAVVIAIITVETSLPSGRAVPPHMSE